MYWRSSTSSFVQICPVVWADGLTDVLKAMC